MPILDPRDAQGRTFAEYVADQVMAAVASAGRSVRDVADEAGINRETLRGRINGVRPFTVAELSAVAVVLDLPPVQFAEGFVSDDRR